MTKQKKIMLLGGLRYLLPVIGEPTLNLPGVGYLQPSRCHHDCQRSYLHADVS